MTRLRWVTILALFLIAIGIGGAVARLAVLFGQLRALVVVLLVVVVLIAVGVTAAKSGRWLANPYW